MDADLVRHRVRRLCCVVAIRPFRFGINLDFRSGRYLSWVLPKLWKSGEFVF